MGASSTRSGRVSARSGRTEPTRERLLSAAVELLEEGGYAAATVAAIAKRSGVAVGALYRHFPSKAELFVEIFRTKAESQMDDLREAGSAPGTAVDKLDAVVREYIGNVLEQPRLAWALGYEPVDPLVDAERLAYRRTYRERLAELLRRGIEAGDLPDQDAELTAASLIGAISEALVGPLSPVRDEGASKEETAEAIAGLCRRAVGAQ
jgi:AcrR family transcriptional regulator